MQRICFVLHIRRGKIEEYQERHAAIWPTMVEALQDAGWKNYSLFLQPDGLLVGYFETDDSGIFAAPDAGRLREHPMAARYGPIVRKPGGDYA